MLAWEWPASYRFRHVDYSTLPRVYLENNIRNLDAGSMRAPPFEHAQHAGLSILTATHTRLAAHSIELGMLTAGTF